MKNEFTAIIEKDDNWYTAYCPEIPGANGQYRGDEESAATEPEKRVVLSAKLTAWSEYIEALIPEPNPDFVPWDGREPLGLFWE